MRTIARLAFLLLARSPCLELLSPALAKYDLALELPKGALKPREAADFVIAISDGARVLIDQAFLVPADQVGLCSVGGRTGLQCVKRGTTLCL